MSVGLTPPAAAAARAAAAALAAFAGRARRLAARIARERSRAGAAPFSRRTGASGPARLGVRPGRACRLSRCLPFLGLAARLVLLCLRRLGPVLLAVLLPIRTLFLGVPGPLRSVLPG